MTDYQTRIGYLSGALRVSTHPQSLMGGPRSHILGLTRGLEQQQCRVLPYIVGDQIPQQVNIAQSSKQDANRAHWKQYAIDGVRLANGLVHAHRAWQTLSGRVDWVYERFATLQSLGRYFKKRGVPWVLEMNGPFFAEAQADRHNLALTGLARKWEIQAYQDCDVIVCVSQALRDLLVFELDIPDEKILVLPNGVDTESYHPGRVTPLRVFDEDCLTVGFVGKLSAWQGLDRLFRAVHELRHAGVRIGCVIVGDGLEAQNWRSLVRALDLDDHVHFTGWVAKEDVMRYIAGFDVGYSGQRRMSIGTMYHSPLKMYEYMALAKPVIATRYDDACAALKDNVTGFLFDDDDDDTLKDALCRAYMQRDSLAAMGEAARQDAVTHHSWQQRAAELLGFVDAVLA